MCENIQFAHVSLTGNDRGISPAFSQEQLMLADTGALLGTT